MISPIPFTKLPTNLISVEFQKLTKEFVVKQACGEFEDEVSHNRVWQIVPCKPYIHNQTNNEASESNTDMRIGQLCQENGEFLVSKSIRYLILENDLICRVSNSFSFLS